MPVRIAGYLAAAAVSVYLYFMYNETVLSGVVVFLVLYPLASGVYLLLAGNRISPELTDIPISGAKGKRIRAGVFIRNRSSLLGLRYACVLKVRLAGERTGEKQILYGMLPPAGKENRALLFRMETCGMAEITLESVRVYDFLGVFYRRIKGGQAAGVRVMPEFAPVPLEITRRTREFQADAQEFSAEKKGDDPSETYQVRAYRERDFLKDIHWKLSAREGKLMVKERGFPLGCVILLYMDCPEGKRTAEGISHMLETAASLSITLISEACIHMAAWYDEAGERMVTWRISDEESAWEMVWNLMDMKPYRDREKERICFADTFRNREFAGVLTVDGNGRIKKDGIETEYPVL